MKIQVLVATQKQISFKLDKCYSPIYVGADFHIEDDTFGYLKDNSGENISNKNKSFCELTALYWQWKNSKADITGLCHYRRYLSDRRYTKNPQYILSENRIEQLMKSYDLILPKEYCLYGTALQQYSTGQHKKDYLLCGEILKEKYPEYWDDFQRITDSDTIFICNMYIGKKKIIDNYCSWLFDILFELEKRTDLTGYTVAEKRIYGYLSERLFNVWILHNKPSVYRCPLLNTETTFIREGIRLIHTFNYKVLGIDVLKHAAKRKEKKDRRNGKR
jgi:hypothetical protein